MLPCHHGSWALALLVLAVVAAAEIVKYDIILDAGSTGTRMYLFTSTFSVNGEGEEVLKVATKKIGKKKPGLSAYADNPDGAAAPLLQLFKKVQSEIPGTHVLLTTVSVLGTAGMRSVSGNKQQPIYDSVRAGLIASGDYIFSKGSLLKLRTVNGTEEGTFSLLCVNFLTGRLNHHLALTKKGLEEQLLGILDLGGSSTQIAVPPTDNAGDAAVRSYAAYGMEQMRGRLDKVAIEEGMPASPCYFKGYQEPESNLGGSGLASECRLMLLKILGNSKQDCATDDHECLPGIDSHAGKAGARGMQFFAVSGYLYVTDFASHWLTRDGQSSSIAAKLKEVGNKPTIKELHEAADHLCSSEWGEIERAHAGGAEAGAHRYTDSTKAPHRCLEINYVITLLQSCYGFPDDKRLVTFEDEVDGNDVEWPLGALLKMKHEARLVDEKSHGEL